MSPRGVNISGYSPIKFDKNCLNFDMFRQKRAFLYGATQSVTPVMPAVDGKKKPAYAPFHPVGDVLPIEAKEPLASIQDYSRLFTLES